VEGDKITLRDIEPVLLEGYGLQVLLNYVQLDLVEHEAAMLHLAVTPQDVASERAITMENLRKATEQMDSSGQPTTEPDSLSPGQEEQLLDQLLQQQRVSRAEFALILQINAYLRKIAEPKVNANLTDAMIRDQFNVMYGERVIVHYIQCDSMSEIAEVKHDLASGKSFEDVARARSIDKLTAGAGGALPPFSLQDPNYPDEIKQVVFELKVGEVSDPVAYKQFFYLFKLVDKIPPAHAKFEDYRDAVKKELHDRAVQAAMKIMRDELATQARASLRIFDPILAQQWEDRVNNRAAQIQGQNQIRQELDHEHAPATQPATAP
jgi:hypothetical protein